MNEKIKKLQPPTGVCSGRGPDRLQRGSCQVQLPAPREQPVSEPVRVCHLRGAGNMRALQPAKAVRGPGLWGKNSSGIRRQPHVPIGKSVAF